MQAREVPLYAPVQELIRVYKKMRKRNKDGSYAIHFSKLNLEGQKFVQKMRLDNLIKTRLLQISVLSQTAEEVESNVFRICIQSKAGERVFLLISNNKYAYAGSKVAEFDFSELESQLRER